MAITVTLNGIDVSQYVDYTSVAIQDTMQSTGDSMQFVLNMVADSVFGLPIVPTCGNEIILTDDTTKEFAGTVTKVDRTLGEANRLVSYNCAAIDYTYMLDRRYVNGIFNSNPITDGANASMIRDILEHLKASADGDTTGGDSYYNTFVANINAPYLASGGPVVSNQTYQRMAPSQVFGDLAENTGMIWWIDFDKRVNFRTTTSMLADFLPVISLDDGSGAFGIHVENDMENFFDLNVEDAIDGIGTKAIIKDAVIRSSSTAIDDFTIDANGAANGVSLKLDRRPYDEFHIATIVNLTQGYTATQELEDVHRQRSDTSASADGGTYKAFIYVGRQGGNEGAYVRFAPDAINSGDHIQVTYYYSTNDEHENIDVEQVEAQAEATGGDGFHEFVFSKRSEIAVQDVTNLDIIADMLLSRKSKTLRRGSFTTRKKGWQAGQIFDLKWDRENIEESMWAVILSKTILTPADDPSLNDNIIETTVSFSNIPRGLRL